MRGWAGPPFRCTAVKNKLGCYFPYLSAHKPGSHRRRMHSHPWGGNPVTFFRLERPASSAYTFFNDIQAS